jgi:arsenite methyltransferase
MQEALLRILVDPVSLTPLVLENPQRENDELVGGTLRGANGRTYAIRDSIPRLVVNDDEAQTQTQGSFGFKWQQEHSYGSETQEKFWAQWISEKYGFGGLEGARQYYQNREAILDAGCGSGLSSYAWLQGMERPVDTELSWVGMDISAAIDVARKRMGHVSGAHFVQGDVLHLPFAHESFDTIFSEGVLHHTPSTEKALKSLVPLLKAGGEILFYVYRKKGAIREFSDDYIRDAIADMPPEEAWEALRPLTRLGQTLAELQVEVEVPEDIPMLGIKAGRLDVQRFVYWNVAKMFWNHDLSFEENHHFNFDWYHPRYAHRQSAEEVRRWCEEAGLRIHHFVEEEPGFTVRAYKE